MSGMSVTARPRFSFRGVVSQSWVRCLTFFAGLVVIFSVLSPYFLSLSNLDTIISAAAVTGLLAVGSTFVIGSGGIDLSIASLMALSGTVCASVIQGKEFQGFGFAALIAPAIAITTGGLCGILTGVLVNVTRAPSFIVSLGMLSIARAAAYIVADGMPIYGLPAVITEFGQGQLAGVSWPGLIFLGASIVATVILRKTVLGTHALLLGDNSSAAEVVGINVSRVRLLVYTLSGIFAGIAGFVFMARTNAGDPTAGQNYELVAITAVILGGTKLFGGRATILGTVLGAICLATLQNGLNLLAVSAYYQVLFIGLVLIGAAALERLGVAE